MSTSMPFSQRHTLHPEYGGNTVLRNVGNLPQNYTAPQPRTPRSAGFHYYFALPLLQVRRYARLAFFCLFHSS